MDSEQLKLKVPWLQLVARLVAMATLGAFEDKSSLFRAGSKVGC